MTTAEELVVPSELKFLTTRVLPEQLEKLVGIACTEGLWTVAAEVYRLGKQMEQEGKAVLEDKHAGSEARADAALRVKNGTLMMGEARYYRQQHPVNNFVRGRLK